MKVKISAIKKKMLPSKFGSGTWTVADVKLVGQGEKIFNLVGYSSKFIENLVVGNEISGYVSSRSWTGKNGTVESPTFNKITAEYVYELVLKLSPNVESIEQNTIKTTTIPSNTQDEWETAPESTGSQSNEDPGF